MPKLVRDNVPELLAARGTRIDTVALDDVDFGVALRAKLAEESDEVVRATTAADLLDELADVFEVLTTLLANEGFSEAELVERAAAKRATHGGFTKRLLSTAYEPAD